MHGITRVIQRGPTCGPGGSLNGSCSAARFGTPSSPDRSRAYTLELTSKLLHLSKLRHKRLEPLAQNSTSISLTRPGHFLPQNMVLKEVDEERKEVDEERKDKQRWTKPQ
jgi:hypothetical protein